MSNIVERELRAAKNLPRPYDLNDPAEILRLFREVRGYLHTCRREHHGGDWEGRRHAVNAIESMVDDEKFRRALAAAIAAGA